MLWFAILLLTFGAALLALRPLLKAKARRSTLDHAIAFYEARKAELARQEALGQISAAEREASEAEQARRLLAISRDAAQTEMSEAERQRLARRRKVAALLLLVGLPALSVPIYFRVGQPGQPDMPLAKREGAREANDFASALRQVEQHLARNPDDARGFEVVAPIYLRAGRLEDAIFAFRRIIALRGENAERLADLGEAITAQQNGVISADAKQAFRRAVELDPGFAKARFYIALAVEQDGDLAGSIQQLVALSANLPDSPAKERVEAELDRHRAAGRAPPRAAPSSAEGDPARAIAALPPDERARAIAGMVESLSERLKTQGGSPLEWVRLIQARMVLEEREKAEQALADARKALAADAAGLATLDQLAGRLGLAPRPETKP